MGRVSGPGGDEGKSENVARRGGDERPPWTRCRVDLVSLFLDSPDTVALPMLMRHVLLNPRDESVALADTAELGVLLEHYIDEIGPLKKRQRGIRMREMLGQIKDGLVEPADLPPPTDAELEEYARRVANSAAEVPALLAEFKQRPPVGSMRGLSHLTVGGRIYLHSQFNDLPESDRLNSEIRARGFEFLGAVCLWFEGRGFAERTTLDALLVRAGEAVARRR